MSDDTEANQDLPLEFPKETAAPAKKTARKAAKKVAKKAAKKVARKTARKAVAEVASEAPKPAPTPAAAPKGEFRPADLKGRGSHAEAAGGKIEVAPDVVPDKPARSEAAKEKPQEQPKEQPKERRSDRQDSGDSENSNDSGDGNESRDDRPQGQHGRHGNPQKKQFNKNKKQGGNRNQNQQFQQKGGKFNKQGGRNNNPHNNKQGGRQQGGGWKQPPPPSESDFVEGELPDTSKLGKFEECEAALAELESSTTVDVTELYELKLDPLVAAVKELGVTFEEKPGRRQVLEALFKHVREAKGIFKDVGFLDLTDAGHGFVVHEKSNYQLKPESTFVPASLIKHFSLKRGHEIEVLGKAPEEVERCPSALKIVSAMGQAPEEMAKVTPFEDLVPYYPTERLVLERPDPTNNKKDVSMRAFDLLTPIGFGQRGLIVAPPRTGKTILLQGLANSVQENWPKAHLIVLLIDERPEEVTDFRRRVNGEVISSTFDEMATSHVHAAEMVGEKARRMAEQGKDVVILLDSITRLARAYNTLASNSGKIMSGGIEATALQKPKRFFGAARNIEDGGSITIMGTALIDTGSKMDEVIFEEFKGTGNMEIHLDRDLINKRVFPAINFERSGTRKEELLYHPQEMEKVYGLRRVMQGVPGIEAMEMLIKRLKVTKNNIDFLMSLK